MSSVFSLNVSCSLLFALFSRAKYLLTFMTDIQKNQVYFMGLILARSRIYANVYT